MLRNRSVFRPGGGQKWIWPSLLLAGLGCGDDPVTRQPDSGNRPPVIRAITVSGARVLTRRPVTVIAAAIDPDNDFVNYRWRATRGSFPLGSRAASVTWATPDTPGPDTLYLEVWDFDDTTRASRGVSVVTVAPPGALSAVAGTSIVDLQWQPSPDDGAPGWLGYEIYRSPRPFDQVPAESLDVLLVGGPETGQQYRAAGLTRGVQYWFAIRSLRGWEDRSEKSALSASAEAIPRPEWNKQIQEIRHPLGGQAFDLSTGSVVPLDPSDPSGRFSRDLYFGTSDPLDLGGEGGLAAGPRLKSVSALANRDPLWAQRRVLVKRIGTSWQTGPITDDGWSEEVDLELGAVYAIKTPEGNYAKLLVADLQGAISPYRQLTVKWAYQLVPGYPRI